MSMKRTVVCLLVLAMLLIAPTTAAYADIASGVGSGAELGSDATKPYRRDENYVDVQPGDIDIWDNGKGISFSAGGEICSLNHSYNQYLVLISKYLDSDGKYTLQVNIFIYSMSATFNPEAILISDDGSVYVNVRLGYDVYEYCVKMRDGMFLSPDDTWTQDVELYYSNRGSSSAFTSRFGFCVAPYYSGKYIIYSSYETLGSSNSPRQGFPVNLLPNAPLGAGSTNIPYKTTFRMLTGEATVYNTFYYTSSYQSGADVISAAGTIRLDATKLVDGSVTRTRPSAPQLLCQISSYGTVYDIVYTNDDNLLSLLGIEKPPEKYWDVSSQEWKNVSSSGGSGNGSSGNTGGSGIDSSLLVEDTSNLSTIKNLTLKLVGEDALIDAVRFNDYYAGHVGHDNMLEDLNTPVWGLGNYITWDYDGILYDPADGGTLLTSYKNRRQVKLVVKAKFRLDATTTKTLTYTLYDYSTTLLTHGIAIGVGSWKVSFYDLCLYFQNAYPEYITDFPTQLQQVSYYLTPFYYDSDEGKYHYGSTSQVTQVIKSALADYSGDEWDGDDDGWTNIEDTSGFEWIWQGIGSGVSNIAVYVKNMISSGEGIFYTMGQVPRMVGNVFSFIPTELVTVIGVGLGLWFLPSLLGLAKQAMEAVGNVAVAAGGAIAKIIQAIIKVI